MLNPKLLMQLASGTTNEEVLSGLLKALGMNMSIATVPFCQASFEPVAQLASLPNAKILEMKGTDKEGNRIHALFVFKGGNPTKPAELSVAPDEKMLLGPLTA
jgi:hypothetical protein